ncbi:hypothetical protein CPB86DRAFT_58230 [Serendipita vermifera]|nr:hypothetical protein CPB86DRAFT_58230 [Serendipita vermifera]
MLSLLSYHRAVIVSLTVDAENNFSSSNGINSDGFETLNLDLLEEINLKSIGHEDAGLLMDSALQSTCEMDIRLEMEFITSGLFSHELLKRAIRLDISAETGESFTSPKIQLPYLKSLVLDGDYGVFDAFDLRDSGMEELTYSSRYREYISPISLPIQLRSLILSSVDFVSKPPQPHPLVHLTTLEFGCTTLEYPLQEYIALPKLKHLDIYNVLFEPVEDEENPNNAVSNSNQSFLRVLPELETISIKQMTLDGSTVEVLQFCPRLKSLTLEECDADFFFRSFLSCLYRKDIFRSLDTFGIILSWPWKYMTFEEFVELCTARRPGIDISWDNCYY